MRPAGVAAEDSDAHRSPSAGAEATGRVPARDAALVYWRPYADVAQLVEHNLAKVGVAGSNPVVRSKRSCRSAPVRPGLLRVSTPLVPHEPPNSPSSSMASVRSAARRNRFA